MSKLVIVGTVAFDAIETPFGKTDKILGGAATFIGLAASQFNVDAAIVSVVGGDFPEEYLDLLSNKKIDISGIEIVKEGKTFFWSGKYHNDMNTRDTLVTELNVLADFNPVVPEDYKNAGGTEDVGSKDDRKQKWLEVVRDLYKKAWNSDKNELIIMWAKSHLK